MAALRNAALRNSAFSGPLRAAAGVMPGSEVAFSLEGSKIIITPVATSVRTDRRAELRDAAAAVRKTLTPEFRQMGANDIMAFLRGEAPSGKRRGSSDR